METVTLGYDKTNLFAKSLLEVIRQSGVFSVSQPKTTDVSPYNKQFVKEILDTEKQEGKRIAIDDLWN